MIRVVSVSKCESLLAAVWIKRANMQKMCCFIWLVATVWSSLPLLGWGEYVPEPYGLSCTATWRDNHTSSKDAFYIASSFCLFMPISFLFIVVSQYQIYFRITRVSRQVSEGSIHNKLKHTQKKLFWVNKRLLFCPRLLE